MERQLAALAYALLCGALCGVLYDAVRIMRVMLGLASYTAAGKTLYQLRLPLIGVVHPQKRRGTARRLVQQTAVALGDILFFIAAGGIFSVFLYHRASGEFRWFYLLGAAVGFFLYYCTCGRIVMLSSEAVSFVIRAAWRYVLWVLLLPVRGIVFVTKRAARMVRKRIWLPASSFLYRQARIRYTSRIQKQLIHTVALSGKGADSIALEK